MTEVDPAYHLVSDKWSTFAHQRRDSDPCNIFPGPGCADKPTTISMRPDGPRDDYAGPEGGPAPPFPIKLQGPVIKGFGRGSKEVGHHDCLFSWWNEVGCGVTVAA